MQPKPMTRSWTVWSEIRLPLCGFTKNKTNCICLARKQVVLFVFIFSWSSIQRKSVYKQCSRHSKRYKVPDDVRCYSLTISEIFWTTMIWQVDDFQIATDCRYLENPENHIDDENHMIGKHKICHKRSVNLSRRARHPVFETPICFCEWYWLSFFRQRIFFVWCLIEFFSPLPVSIMIRTEQIPHKYQIEGFKTSSIAFPFTIRAR